MKWRFDPRSFFSETMQRKIAIVARLHHIAPWLMKWRLSNKAMRGPEPHMPARVRREVAKLIEEYERLDKR